MTLSVKRTQCLQIKSEAAKEARKAVEEAKGKEIALVIPRLDQFSIEREKITELLWFLIFMSLLKMP